MYFRNRNPIKDDPTLVEIGIDNFDVPAKKIQRILNQAYEVLVACDHHHQIIGFLCYRLRVNHMVFVDYVMLRHDLQGRGIARKLLPAFEKHMTRNGVTTIYAFVDRENEQGLQSLKRFGFEVKGTLLSNYIIEKNLQPSVSEASLINHVKKLTSPPRLKYK